MKQQNPVLNPKLQGVLSCLDVQLEAELIRYRRQQAKTRSQSGNGKANPLAALDLKAFNAHPLGEPISPSLSLAQGVPVRHPDLTPTPLKISAPHPIQPTQPTQPTETQDTRNFAAVSSPQDLNANISPPHRTQGQFTGNLEDFRSGLTDPLDRSDFLLTEPLEISADGDLVTAADLENPGEVLEDSYTENLYSEDSHEDSYTENPYIIVTETYTPQSVNWLALTHESWNPLEDQSDIPTVLEVPTVTPTVTPTVEPPESPVGSEEMVTDDGLLGALVLPAELSEAELSALGGLSLAPLAIGSGEEVDWPDYELSDEDNPWPDELDEEPYALDTSFPEAISPEDFDLVTDLDGLAVPASPIEDEILPPTAIERSLEEPFGAPKGDSMADHSRLTEEEDEISEPLMLPAAGNPYPLSRLVPVGQYASHHLKPLGRPSPLPPEAYLASSEALLENLEEEEEGRQSWTQRFNNLFTPQGIGSALLLIFSALAVSMVLLNPELISHWKLGRFAGSAPDSTTNPAPEAVLPESPPVDSSNPYSLSSQEFLNLDLGNLSKVKPQTSSATPGLSTVNPSLLNPGALNPSTLNSSTTETTGPSASTEEDSEMFSDLRDSLTGADRESNSSAEVSQEPQPRRAAAPVSPRAASAPISAPISAPVSAISAPLNPPVIAEPEEPPANPAPSQQIQQQVQQQTQGSSGNTYVVVTPYTSDQLLDQSQTIVPDAYLKNTDQGANIQFGVFSDPNAAAALAEQLQEQGIAVEVVPAER